MEPWGDEAEGYIQFQHGGEELEIQDSVRQFHNQFALRSY